MTTAGNEKANEKMEYYSGSSISGPLEQIYPQSWCHSNNDGGYAKGQNFLHIHWEVHERDAKSIRLHVESPRAAVDPVLNNLKHEIINALLQSDLDDVVRRRGYQYKVGTRLSDTAIQNNKSTEPFRVILTDGQLLTICRQSLELIHNAIGPDVDRIIRRFDAQVKQRFGE